MSEKRTTRMNERGVTSPAIAAVATAIVIVLVLVLLVGIGYLSIGPKPSTTTSQPSPTPGATVVTSVMTGSLQANSSWAPATHTLTFKIADISGKYVLCASNATACVSTSPGFFNVPLSFSRSDGLNSSAGFNIAVNGVPTATPSGGTQSYSPIGYTASTSTSGGTWQILFSQGSLKASYPNQNAPTVTTGLGPDLIGVPAFGSNSLMLGFTLAGHNSTSGAFATTGYAQYTTESFTINISGGGGSTPSAVAVDLILI